jgi:RNA polymerase sigma factor (sigma-70 family)
VAAHALQPSLWKAVLAGDRNAFRQLVTPYLDELLQAAQRELIHYQRQKVLRPEDLSSEELVGETLLTAWRQRHRKPRRLSVRAWLLGLLHRVLVRYVARERTFRRLWELSLDEPLPPTPIYDDDESFWEWYQPDDLERWEDVLPDPATLTEEWVAVEETPPETLEVLEPLERQVLLLHDLHKLSIQEVAIVMQRSIRETAELLQRARRHLQRVSS